MTQELFDLRTSILEGRLDDALAIIDDLEWMSKKNDLRNIKSFLIRMLSHLIKNQVEQRLTNSWAASILDSVRQIQDLNLRDNKISYYINIDEWQEPLEEALEAAIRVASVKVREGEYSPRQLSQLINRNQIIQIAQQLLNLTYTHSAKTLPDVVDENLAQLPGGEDWLFGRR